LLLCQHQQVQRQLHLLLPHPLLLMLQQHCQHQLLLRWLHQLLLPHLLQLLQMQHCQR
jgi:hypothetical protein